MHKDCLDSTVTALSSQSNEKAFSNNDREIGLKLE